MAKTGKLNLSLATVSDLRIPLWPVGKVKDAQIIETPWGVVLYDNGAPTARQRDVIDAIAACALAEKIDAVGRKHILFDAADVAKLLDCDDWHWIKAKLNGLLTTKISSKQPGADWGKSRTVLAGVDDSDLDAPRTRTQYQAKLKKIIFSELMTSLLEIDLLVHCSPEVTRTILAMDHQVSRSLARWCISHSTDQHHLLPSVIKALGCGGGERMYRKYAAQLRADQQGLVILGIEISDGLVHYKKQSGVWFKKNNLLPKLPEPRSAGADK